jgi:rod shape-determining protein MreD
MRLAAPLPGPPDAESTAFRLNRFNRPLCSLSGVSMIGRIRIVFLIIISVILQVAFFPVHLADPFKPNLLIMFVVYMGFRENIRWGGIGSFLLGLIQDSLSGIYFGLNGFSFLLIFVILKAVSSRLYTDSRALMVIGVFLATVFNGFLSLVLLGVFSIAESMYSTVLSNIFPQSMVNAILAYAVFRIIPLRKKEETA